MSFKELLESAKEELKGLSSIENPDFRLEQAVYNRNEKVWDIVVSFLVENTNKRTTSISALVNDYPYNRIFKKLKLAEDKSVIGLYMYND